MTIFDPFTYRPASTPEESAQRLVGDLAGRVIAQERANVLAALSVQSPWQSITPTANFAGAPPASSPPRFYIDSVGRVYIAGILVVNATISAYPALMFTLPEGFRPPYAARFATGWVTAGSDGFIEILNDGTAWYIIKPGGTNPTVGWEIGLDHLSFRITVPGEV